MFHCEQVYGYGRADDERDRGEPREEAAFLYDKKNGADAEDVVTDKNAGGPRDEKRERIIRRGKTTARGDRGVVDRCSQEGAARTTEDYDENQL